MVDQALMCGSSVQMFQPAIMEAFKDLPDPRRSAGQRHQHTRCLALFILVVTASNHGFLAIGDWIAAYLC